MSNMTYTYKEPAGEKVHFTKEQHRVLFPQRQRNLFKRYDYYLSNDRLEIQQLPTVLTKALVVITLPIALLLYGVANYKEVIYETKHILQPKKYGAFVSDVIWERYETYEKARKMLDAN